MSENRQRPTTCISAVIVVALAGSVGQAAPNFNDDVLPLEAPRQVAERTVAAWKATPRELEFTGRLMARPLAAADWIGRGLTGPQADARARGAIDRLAKFAPVPIEKTGEFILKVADAGDGVPERAAAIDLLATGDYAYVEPDWLCFPLSVPNDPRLSEQYHHTILRSTAAWDMATGSGGTVYAFVDTGVDVTHPDLAPRLVPGYNVPQALEQINGGPVIDMVGHGTFVAGCAAATGNNGQGTCGMGWGLSIMPVRASDLESGAAPISNLLAGARWAAEHGARVVSVSYSGVQNAGVNTTGTYVKANNGLLFWAAGNSAANWSGFDHADAIVVGATDDFDRSASFSGFGRAVDCVAPGVNILSTNDGNEYGLANGTSFATPLAAGLAAVMFDANPTLTPAQVEERLLLGCDDLGDPGDDNRFGRGRINAAKALSFAVHGPGLPVATADAFAVEAGATVTLDVLANDADALGRTLGLSGIASGGQSTLGGTLSIFAGAGPGGRDLLTYTAPLTPGDDTFTYAATNPEGAVSATARVTVAPTSAFRAPDALGGSVQGLNAQYFDLDAPTSLPDFNTLVPYLEKVWLSVNFLPTLDDFPGALRFDNFGARATGFFLATLPGRYSFTLWSDDGSRLRVGGETVVDNDGVHTLRSRTGSILLQPGLHALTVEFFEQEFSAGLVLAVEGPDSGGGGLPAVIPEILLRRPGNPVDFNRDGFLSPDDLDEFITAYFEGDPSADFDLNFVLTPDDLDAFITAYFEP